MTKHTPGPDQTLHRECIKLQQDIARIAAQRDDLLAAAKVALSDLKFCAQELPCHERAQGILRAAIKKAEVS